MAAKLTAGAKGVYVIAATPFDEDGSVDRASIDSLVSFYLESGVTGMTILGVMGEAAKLTQAEARETARKNRDFAAADQLRDEIQAAGFKIVDTKDGPRLERL